jgi:hypothetical protein
LRAVSITFADVSASSAIGFSHSTGLPAAIAARAIFSWNGCGVAM